MAGALNAGIYATADYVAVTNEEQNSFWDKQKIEETVTPGFVRENIGNKKVRKVLDTNLSFGEGLTESTYTEWIVGHAKSIFLILLQLGIPESIIKIVDGSWTDDDLPLSPEAIERLGLESSNLGKKFLKKQFRFIVRNLEAGGHIDYHDDESVPIEVASTKRQGRNEVAEKVYFPREKDQFFIRRKIPLGEDIEGIPKEVFLAEIEAMKAISHSHFLYLFASYTYMDNGYLIFSPVCELNLKQFIHSEPRTFKSLPKDRRRRILFEWMHCLSDALAYLYDRGVAHRDIRPKSVLIDQYRNQVYFADIGNGRRLEPKLKPYIFEAELYEYGAPELWKGSAASEEAALSPITITAERHSQHHSSAIESTGSLRYYYNNISNGINPSIPIISPALSFTVPPALPSAASPALSSATFPSLSSTTSPALSSASSVLSSAIFSVPQWTTITHNPAKSDTFSLACIFLDILSFYAKRRPSAFAAHRGKMRRRHWRSEKPDESFHANLEQVGSWIDELEKDIGIGKDDHTFLRILDFVRVMIAYSPDGRPEPREAQMRVFGILELEFGDQGEKQTVPMQSHPQGMKSKPSEEGGVPLRRRQNAMPTTSIATTINDEIIPTSRYDLSLYEVEDEAGIETISDVPYSTPPPPPTSPPYDYQYPHYFYHNHHHDENYLYPYTTPLCPPSSSSAIGAATEVTKTIHDSPIPTSLYPTPSYPELNWSWHSPDLLSTNSRANINAPAPILLATDPRASMSAPISRIPSRSSWNSFSATKGQPSLAQIGGVKDKRSEGLPLKLKKKDDKEPEKDKGGDRNKATKKILGMLRLGGQKNSS